jgi:hypothetical protein
MSQRAPSVGLGHFDVTLDSALTHPGGALWLMKGGVHGGPKEAVMYGHERRQRHRDYEDTDVVVGEREAAKRSVRARRDFASNVVSYVVINAALNRHLGPWRSRVLLACMDHRHLGRDLGPPLVERIRATSDDRGGHRCRGESPPALNRRFGRNRRKDCNVNRSDQTRSHD